MSQYINIPSICEHFPSGINVPPRLLELLEWLNITIDDQVGWFPEFIGESFDWYSSTIDLSPYFGIFAQLGDGSLLAYWFYEGCDKCNPPIVVIGSEGDLGVASGSIEGFVARLVRKQFPDTSWIDHVSNFYLYPDQTWLEQLEVWARQAWNLTSENVQELISSFPEQNHPNLEEWMNDKVQEQE